MSAEAGHRLAEIVGQNDGLETFKGIGRLELYRKEGRQGVRAAWLCAFPDRMRLELLGMTGAPVASMAADGVFIHLYLHDRRKGYRRSAKSDAFSNLVDIDLELSEIVSILAGKIPLGDFVRARVEDGVLVLEDGSGNPLQKIYPAENELFPARMVETFDRRGRLRHRVFMESFRRIDGFWIPGHIRVDAEGGEGFRLSVDRVWTNPEVPQGAFFLETGGAGSSAGP